MTEQAWADLDDNLDLSEIEAREGGFFIEWEAGIYPAVVSDYDRWSSEEGDRRCIRFHYEVTEGPRAGDTYQHWFNIPNGPKSDENVQKALGYVKGNFKKIGAEDGPYTADAIKGIEVVFTLTETKGRGKHVGRTFINLSDIAPRRGVSADKQPATAKSLLEAEDDPFAD